MAYNTAKATEDPSPVPLRREEGALHLVDCLLDIYETPPFDIPKRSYLEFALLVGRLVMQRVEKRSDRISAERIYEGLSQTTAKDVDPKKGGKGVTSIASKPTILSIQKGKFDFKTRTTKKTKYTVGPKLAKAIQALEPLDITSFEIAELVAEVEQQGGAIDEIVDRLSGREAKAETENQERHQKHEKEEESTNKHTTTGHCVRFTRLSDLAETPQNRGLERSGPSFVKTGFVHWCQSHPLSRPADSLRFTKSGASEPVLGDAAMRTLLAKQTPFSPYVDTAKELYDMLVAWRPVLASVPGHMAMVQYILHSVAYDDSNNHDGAAFTYKQVCTGVVIPYTKIYACYGLTRHFARRVGVHSTSRLLDLYRRDVDLAFNWSAYSHKNGQARVITSHGIPSSITDLAKDVMYQPWEVSEWTNMITGEGVSRRNWGIILHDERMEALGDDPEPNSIALPDSSKRIKEYLNDLEQKIFSHGRTGIVTDSAYERARNAIYNTRREDGSLRFPTEQRRDRELRKLFWICRYPKPLYKGCARSPRLKADHYNQLMNLPTEMRTALMIDRDVDVDLEKAHFGSMVPIAEREGIDMPVTREYLQASLSGEIDLWRDIANTFGEKVDYPEAARTAAKKLYAAVYGGSKEEMLRGVCFTYAEKSGVQFGFDPFRPALTHPMMKEVLDVREQLKSIINDRGGIEDVSGRFIPLSAWNEVKKAKNRWRGVLSYYAASYEQELMAEVFDCAQAELDAASENGRRKQFWIWLYQSDGCTIRFGSRVSDARRTQILNRIQERVDERAADLGVITALDAKQADPK